MNTIDLQFPYTLDWDKAVVRMCEDGRRRVTLWRKRNGKLERKGTAYARYLMAVHLGRYLEEDEIVDHKDEDKTNDTIDNLQILDNIANVVKNGEFKRKKRAAEGKPVMIILECPVCEEAFMRRSSMVAYKLRVGEVMCCSRRCGGINSHSSKEKKVA